MKFFSSASDKTKLFAKDLANFGSLLCGQPHSFNVNHCISAILT